MFKILPTIAVFAVTMGPVVAAGEGESSATGSPTTEVKERGAPVWPQWRGPTRDGQVTGPAWPSRLEGRLEPAWRVELGCSYSSPIVAGDRVFTTETVDEKHEMVRAFDRDTGQELWRIRWRGAMEVPFFASRNGSWIRSTPAFDGERLYVGGMRDVLVCLDGRTGKKLWHVDFVERYSAPLPSFGFVCSPLVMDDGVCVQAGASLVKLDRKTGEEIWRTLIDDGGMYGSAFSSPVLGEVAGHEMMLVLTRAEMTGVDPDLGDVLWRRPIKTFRGMNILTPIVHDGDVFTAAYGGRAQLLTVDESPAGEFEVDSAWNINLQGYMTSPVIIDGHAYLFGRNNRFNCVRLADGEKCWTSPPTGDEYWSLVAQGRRILALADSGVLRLIHANPTEYDVMDEVEVSDASTWAHLAVTGDQVWVRELEALTAWNWNPGVAGS